MKTKNFISTDELRFKFKHVLSALRQGKRLTLTYRRKPLAVIYPYVEESLQVCEQDPLYTLSAAAEPMGSLENESIDQEVYKG